MKLQLRDRGCVPASERAPQSFAEAEGITSATWDDVMETVGKFPA